MARIFLETNDSARTANDNNDTFYGLAGDQAVTVKAKGITVDAAVEGLFFAGQMSDYTFYQSGPNTLKVMKGADLIATAFVQADANGTQLTFANGTVDAKLGTPAMTLGGTALGAAAVQVTPVTINPDKTTPGEVTPPPVSTTSNLTVDQDNLLGTGGDNTFTGYIFDNQNTLQNGDMIDGGAGTDSLYVELGNSQNFAIQPRLTSVENIFIQAQATDIRDEADNFNSLPLWSPLGDQDAPFSYNEANHDGFTQIDAGKIAGVRQLWSDDSRANLVIEDVSVNSHLTTIGMRDTDPGNVNYEVYFDPQNITSPGAGSEGATLTVRLADVLALEVTGNGLNELPYDGINLLIGGEAVTLDIDFAIFTSSVDPYGDLVDAMQAALNAKGYSSITVTEAPEETAVFSITVTDQGNTYLQGTTASSLYSPIVMTNSGPASISMVGYTLQPGTVEPSGNLVRTAIENEASTTPSLTQVDIILDNVARGDVSGSGDLVIGDMSESGIQQFNVQVDRSSHLDQLASTNNILEVINVENIGANGDLRINQIDDVRVFDASTMVGDVTLGAYLSENVTEKYLNLQDTATDPAADNSEVPYLNVVDTEFSYDLGTGDDTLDLAISANNFSAAGTTNREDFVLEINGNAGDDDITFSIVEPVIINEETVLELANGTDENWYLNSNLNANLTINGGAGDDTISKPGSGNVIINAGSGDDTVYADNTGDRAVFVFNTNGDNVLSDLGSDVNDSNYRIFKGTLTVTFQGFNVTVPLPNTTGVVSDLQVNQAIKFAINGNDVLNKLLVANDGPANTLVVTSLIDGELILSDLVVSIAAPTTLTNPDVQLLNSYYGTPGGTEASNLAILTASVAAFNANADYVTAFAVDDFATVIAGSNSDHISDNIITGGTGNDVLVLGTGAFSNDTVVYEGFGNSSVADTIVNFQAGLEIPLLPTAETFVVTFNAAVGPGAFEFDGTTIALPLGTETAAQVAALVAGETYTNWTAVDNLNGTVTFTNAGVGNVTDVIPADFLTDYTVATTTGTEGVDAIPTPAVAAVNETYNVLFNAASAVAGQTIVFDGITVNIPASSTVAAIAALITANDAAFLNWTVVNNLDGTVTLTSATAATDVLDITNADFGGTADLLQAVVKIADGAPAVPAGTIAAVPEEFTATFTAATDAGYITFADGQIPVLVGQTALEIAANAAAELYTGWTAVDNLDGTVTYTATAGGVQEPVLTFTTLNPVASVVVTDGTDGQLDNIDYLDFSSYDVAAVFVNVGAGAVNITGGVVVAGAEYVLMTESATNDGSYTIAVYTEAGATDTLVGTIGVADFGVQQAFVADNFII